MDFERLSKILMLTTSDSDGEALVAIRKANALLSKANLTWHDVVTPARAPRSQYRDPHADEISEMLSTCLDRVQGAARTFIVSLSEQFERTGRLSAKQRAALRKFYANCTN